MADNPPSSLNPSIEILHQLEKLRKELGIASVKELVDDMLPLYKHFYQLGEGLGFPDTTAFVQDITEVYQHVCIGLASSGSERHVHHVEAINIWNMAEKAAHKGHSLGIVSGTLGAGYELESTIMPGSLVEIRDDALEVVEKAAKRKRDLIHSAANTSTPA